MCIAAFLLVLFASLRESNFCGLILVSPDEKAFLKWNLLAKERTLSKLFPISDGNHLERDNMENGRVASCVCAHVHSYILRERERERQRERQRERAS